jgi:hypothetical protein
MLKDSKSGTVTAPSGEYKTVGDQTFKVSTSGATALTVRSSNGKLCLRFWRQKQPVGEDGLLRLDGQTCDNKKFGDLDWQAMFSYKKPSLFILYPPGTFALDDVRPIEIRYDEA